jgi:hypothetical protein
LGIKGMLFPSSFIENRLKHFADVFTKQYLHQNFEKKIISKSPPAKSTPLTVTPNEPINESITKTVIHRD